MFASRVALCLIESGLLFQILNPRMGTKTVLKIESFAFLDNFRFMIAVMLCFVFERKHKDLTS